MIRRGPPAHWWSPWKCQTLKFVGSKNLIGFTECIQLHDILFSDISLKRYERKLTVAISADITGYITVNIFCGNLCDSTNELSIETDYTHKLRQYCIFFPISSRETLSDNKLAKSVKSWLLVWVILIIAIETIVWNQRQTHFHWRIANILNLTNYKV